MQWHLVSAAVPMGYFQVQEEWEEVDSMILHCKHWGLAHLTGHWDTSVHSPPLRVFYEFIIQHCDPSSHEGYVF